MKFFVNFLSAFRIFAAFAIIPTLWFNWFWVSLIMFVLAALSDFFDGYLARKYDVCTKIGGVMDHIGDKLLVANTLIMLTVMMRAWIIVVPVIIMIARELYVSGLREFLGTQKIEMPVPHARFSMGKIKTTLQMITITAFLAFFVLNTVVTPDNISRSYLIAMIWLSRIGVLGLWLSLLASVWSASQYTFTFVEKLKKVKKK